MEWNPFDPEFNADPYPHYHRLRETDPVHEVAPGIYLVTRYDDAVELLRDARFGKDGYQALLAARFGDDRTRPGLAVSMLFRDPPDHTRLRGLVSQAFTPRVVEQLRGRVERLVDELLDRAADRRAMDVIADLAYPLPVTIISEMLGVPAADRDTIREWSTHLAGSLDAILLGQPDLVERGIAGREGLVGYFRDLAAERRRRPGPDLLSALLEAEERGDRLTEDELLATCVLLYVAGHETTVNLIGNGTLALLRHPAQLAALAADPALAESAVEELLRYDSPVQRVGRICDGDDVEFAGRPIPKGAVVVAVIGAANRDPAHFPDPDRLHLARPDNRHVAFGRGIHFCLGAPLARLEGRIGIQALVRRYPRIRLDTDRPAWRPGVTLRGLEALPVAL